MTPCSQVNAIRNGMEDRVKKKGHAGFNIPYGYSYSHGMLKVYPEEAKIVKEIYGWYLEGKSMGEICEMLNSAHVRSKRGGVWAKKCVSSILKNPVYCGYLRWMNYLTMADHEKIVDLIVYNQVQYLILVRHGMTFGAKVGVFFRFRIVTHALWTTEVNGLDGQQDRGRSPG